LGRCSIRESLVLRLRCGDFTRFPVAMPERNSVNHLAVNARILGADRSVNLFTIGKQVDIGGPSSDLIAIAQLFLLFTVDANRDKLPVDLADQLWISEGLFLEQATWRTVVAVEVKH
jgi:hypothetical protein